MNIKQVVNKLSESNIKTRKLHEKTNKQFFDR